MSPRLERHAAEMRLRNLRRRQEEILQHAPRNKFGPLLMDLWEQATRDALITGRMTPPPPAQIGDRLNQKEFEF
jgi:hypothetical protein